MEQLITEIEAYAEAAGTTPQSVLRKSCGYGWGVWETWKSGSSSPSMINADRIRAWIAVNPPKAPDEASPANPTSDAA